MYYFELKAREIYMMDENKEVVSVVVHEPVNNGQDVKYTVVKDGKAYEITGEIKKILDNTRVEHLSNIVKFKDTTRSKEFEFQF